MRKKTLMVVEADPRLDGRAAEALRVAAGLAAWGADLTLCLAGPAAVLLEANADLPGEADIRLAWPVLQEKPVEVFASQLPPAGSATLPGARMLEPGGLASLAGGADNLLRFQAPQKVMGADLHSTRRERIAPSVPSGKTSLQIRTRSEDPLADQAFLPAEMEIIELFAGPPDYDALLEAVFRAGRVRVW